MRRNRRVVLLLLALLLLGSACRKAAIRPEPEHPFSFFYCRSRTQQGDDGVICAEQRDIDPTQTPPMDWLRDYFAGPEDAALRSPFPEGTQPLDFYTYRSVGYLMISREAATLEGLDRTLAFACAAKTLFALDGLQAVSITVQGAEQSATVFRQDIVLRDSVLNVETRELVLYYMDSETGLLQAQRQSVTGLQAKAMPQYALDALQKEPTQDGLLPVLPEAATLLSVSLAEGVCTADYSEALMSDDVEAAAREAAVRAVVATLCALDGVYAVRITVAGKGLSAYGFASDEPLTPSADWFSE